MDSWRYLSSKAHHLSVGVGLDADPLRSAAYHTRPMRSYLSLLCVFSPDISALQAPSRTVVPPPQCIIAQAALLSNKIWTPGGLRQHLPTFLLVSMRRFRLRHHPHSTFIQSTRLLPSLTPWLSPALDLLLQRLLDIYDAIACGALCTIMRLPVAPSVHNPKLANGSRINISADITFLHAPATVTTHVSARFVFSSLWSL